MGTDDGAGGMRQSQGNFNHKRDRILTRHFFSYPLTKVILLLVVAALYLGALAYRHPADYGFLPPCQFHEWTGLFCPGCGATRAVHFLLQGDWKTSLHYNPLVILFLPILLLLPGQWLYEIFYRKSIHYSLQAKFYLGLAIVVIVFFVLRNVPLTGFEILRPPL